MIIAYEQTEEKQVSLFVSNSNPYNIHLVTAGFSFWVLMKVKTNCNISSVTDCKRANLAFCESL